MPVNQGMFSSDTDEWATPESLFCELDQEFHFSLDVCAWDWNTKCPVWLTVFDDALSLDWVWVMREVVGSNLVAWMNPPYGRKIIQWMQKAYESAKAGATVVCLVPSRTDTNWWHRYVMKGEIRYLKGRIKFNGQKNSAPFPSAIVVFRPQES